MSSSRPAGTNGALVAYDLATGEQKWKWAGDAPAYASPVLMTVGDAKLIIAETERRLVALSATDGTLLWETPFGAQGPGGYNAATPVVTGQSIIYSGGGRGTHCIKLEKSSDGYTGKELWNNADESVQFTSPTLKDGLIYGLTQSNELFCLNAATGKTAWTTRLGQAANAGNPDAGNPGGGRPGGFGGPGGGPRPEEAAAVVAAEAAAGAATAPSSTPAPS